MSDQSNPRRPKRGEYRPKAETLALLKVSGTGRIFIYWIAHHAEVAELADAPA